MSFTKNTKLAFAGRFPAPQIPDGHVTLSSNLANRFDATNNITSNSGSPVLIDVLPDGRFHNVAICEEILDLYPKFPKADHEYASPAALAFYCTFLIHVHALHTDLIYRDSASAHAIAIQNDAPLMEFFDQCLDLPVPKIVHDILLGLSRHTSDSHPGLKFMHTYAASRFNQDFHALIPCTMFLQAHNIMATAATNAPVGTLVDEWLRSTLVTVQASTYRVGQYLGCLFDLANVTYIHEDWHNSRLIRLFSPATSRYHKTRPFFSPVRFSTPSIANATTGFNAYQFATGVTVPTVRDFSALLTKLGTYVSGTLKPTHTLGQILVQNVGSNIVNHFISEPILPTHHLHPLGARVVAPAANPTPDPATWQSATHANMAEATNFCQPEAGIADANNAVQPTRIPQANVLPNGANNVNQAVVTPTFTEALYLVSTTTLAADNANPPAWTNSPISRVLYDPDRHYMPSVYFHHPLNAPQSATFSSTISGLRIQSAEIDGLIIPQVNPRTAIAQENTRFLTSCVPIGSLQNWTDNATNHLVYRERETETPLHLRAGIALYDFASNILGRLATAIPAAITAPVGFRVLNGIRYGHEMFSYFTYSHSRGANAQLNGTKRIILWSPYRYVQTEGQNRVLDWNVNPGWNRPSNDSDAVLVLPSLRPIYGTNGIIYGMNFPTSRLD